MKNLWPTIVATAAVISHAKWGFVAAAFAIDTLSLIVMAFRWRLLLRAVGSGASLWDTLLAYSGGVFVSNVTPARTLGGDACRAALIRRPEGIPSMKAIAASILCDRATDGLGFLLLGVLALPTVRPQSHWVLPGLLVLAAALAVRPVYRRLISRIEQGRQALFGRQLTAALGCAVVIWLFDITRIMLVGAALSVRLGPAQAATVSLVRLGSGLVPVPAGLGVVDGALVGGFIWLGVPAVTAAALAVVERAIVLGWATILGAVALLLLGGGRALKNARAGAAALGFASDPNS
jgi:uncharacterized membrane protein YbhN (UPF0104 family)